MAIDRVGCGVPRELTPLGLLGVQADVGFPLRRIAEKAKARAISHLRRYGAEYLDLDTVLFQERKGVVGTFFQPADLHRSLLVALAVGLQDLAPLLERE